MRPLVSTKLVQEMGLITPLLGRRIVWSAMAFRGHLSASVASSPAAVRSLVMTDHVGPHTRTAMLVGIWLFVDLVVHSVLSLLGLFGPAIGVKFFALLVIASSSYA